MGVFDKLLNILGPFFVIICTYLFIWFMIYFWFKKKDRLDEFYSEINFPFIGRKVGKEFFDENPWGVVAMLIVFFLLTIVGENFF